MSNVIDNAEVLEDVKTPTFEELNQNHDVLRSGKKLSTDIVLDDGVSSEIDGDESVPYEDWNKYKDAVEDGLEVNYSKGKEKDEVDVAAAKATGERIRGKRYEFDVDAALDCIDLTFPNYKPTRQAIDFFNLLRVVQGEDFEVGNSVMQYFLVDMIFDNVTTDMFPYTPEINSKIRLNKRKIAIIASRFSAKSTIVTAFIPIYCAIMGVFPGFGKVMFWVGFGDSQQAGAKVQANTIRDICSESQFCKDHFEKMRFTDEECEFLRRQNPGENKSEKNRSFMFKVKGAAGGSVRGIRYRTERPQIISMDDVIKNEADANSDVIMAKIRSMIYSDATNALGRRGKVIIVNTPFNKKDPVYSALESGVWTPIAIPVCEKISLDMLKEDYVGSWEDMKSYEDVMEIYEDAHYNKTLREFNQELMLRISSEEDKLMKKGEIQWYNRRSIEKQLTNYNVVLTTDLTASENTQTGDYSVIMAWAISSNKDWFLLSVVGRRMGIEEQYGPIFDMVQRYGAMTNRTIEVFIETNGQQQLNFSSLRKSMREKNIFFTFGKQIGKPYGSIGISRSGATKHQHFMRVHPWFQSRKVYFPEEMKEDKSMKLLLGELEYITYYGLGASTDDLTDGVSMIGLADVVYPMATYGNVPLHNAKPQIHLGNGIMIEADDEYDDIDAGSGY